MSRRRWFGLRDVCEVNPTDPVCQEFYGNAPQEGPMKLVPGWTVMPGTYTTSPTTTQPPPTQEPIAPGTIVSTGPGKLATFWAGIPTPVKLIGAGIIAFIGYKKFVK